MIITPPKEKGKERNRGKLDYIQEGREEEEQRREYDSVLEDAFE